MKKVIAFLAATTSIVGSLLALRSWMRRGTFKTRQITVSNGNKEKTHYYATGENGEKAMSWCVEKVIHFVETLG